MFVFWSCKNDDTDYIDTAEYYTTVAYVVGYHFNAGITTDSENRTAKAKMYLLFTENMQDTLATKHLPDDLFTFPANIVYSGGFIGYNLFPQENMDTYKVQLTYRVMTKEEESLYEMSVKVNAYHEPKYYGIYPKFIIIKSIEKIN